MVRQNIGWFDAKENMSGILCNKLSKECSDIKGVTGDVVGNLVQIISTIITGLLIAFM